MMTSLIHLTPDEEEMAASAIASMREMWNTDDGRAARDAVGQPDVALPVVTSGVLELTWDERVNVDLLYYLDEVLPEVVANMDDVPQMRKDALFRACSRLGDKIRAALREEVP